MIGAFSHANSPTDIMTHFQDSGSKGRHSFRVASHVGELAPLSSRRIGECGQLHQIYFERVGDHGDIPKHHQPRLWVMSWAVTFDIFTRRIKVHISQSKST